MTKILYLFVFLMFIFKLHTEAVGIINLSLIPLLLMAVLTIATLVLVEREISFRQRIQSQCVILGIYAILFTGCLYAFLSNTNLFFELAKSVDPGKFFQIIIYSLLTAMLQEIVFRKFIIDYLKKYMRIGTAIFLSACVFYLIHDDNNSFVPTRFMAGILYGIIYARYDSLIAIVGMHWLFDTVGFLSSNLNLSTKLGELTGEQVLRGANSLTDLSFQVIFYTFVIIAFVYKRLTSANEPKAALSVQTTGEVDEQ